MDPRKHPKSQNPKSQVPRTRIVLVTLGNQTIRRVDLGELQGMEGLPEEATLIKLAELGQPTVTQAINLGHNLITRIIAMIPLKSRPRTDQQNLKVNIEDQTLRTTEISVLTLLRSKKNRRLKTNRVFNRLSLMSRSTSRGEPRANSARKQERKLRRH